MKRILITGATGSVGKYLTYFLFKQGYEISVTTRNVKKAKEKIDLPIKFIELDLNIEKLIDKDLDVDFIVNLAGESVAKGRWTQSKKDRILHSRVDVTKNIVESIKDKSIKLIQISGANIYKSCEGLIDEDSELDNSFLAHVSKEHEKIVQKVDSTILRLPLILGEDFFTVKMLRLLYRFCAGAQILSSNKVPWVHVEDLCSVIQSVIDGVYKERVINPVAGTMTQKEFHQSLAKFSDRPNPMKVPKFLVKMALGEKSIIVLKNLEVQSKYDLKLKYNSIEDAIKSCFSYIKTPTVKENCFHYSFVKYQYLPKPIEEVFDFFCEAKNLERITPPELNFRILTQSTDKIEEGTKFTYKLSLYKLPFYWTTIIKNWNPPFRFTDFQLKGPYQVWFHTHDFISVEGGTLMTDTVKYRLPLGFLGDLFGLYFVKRNIERIFDFRFNFINEKVVNKVEANTNK